MMEKEKSRWNPVIELMEGVAPVNLGKYGSYWFHKTPRRMLHSLSYYKFASKLIGKEKRVLDIGCNEGLGTYVLSKECGYAKGIDFDEKAIQAARQNFQEPNIRFSFQDILIDSIDDDYDAIVNFDLIEHIYPDNIERFFRAQKSRLTKEGMVIIGTPSEISQKYASNISKKGHVNIYSPQKLKQQMEKHFTFVFLFSANDELVHTGFVDLAHYLIAIGTKKK